MAKEEPKERARHLVEDGHLRDWTRKKKRSAEVDEESDYYVDDKWIKENTKEVSDGLD